MAWAPDSATLEQLQRVLRGTLSANAAERHEAHDALEAAKQQPEVENYLLCILVGGADAPDARTDVRAAAGLLLKNLVLRGSGPDRLFLLDHVLEGLAGDTMVRNITGTLITSLYTAHRQWPVIDRLVEIASGDAGAAVGAAAALAKICEDSAPSIAPAQLPSLIPSLLHLCSLPEAAVRSLALHALNQFVPLQPPPLTAQLDVFLERLFALAADDDSRVRRGVCAAFLLLLEARPETLHPHLDGVIGYCLHSMQDRDSEVAIEACEFLLALASLLTPQLDHEVFRPRLAAILPVLLDKMVYLEEEVFLMELADERDSAAVADRDEDIRPRNAKPKLRAAARAADIDADDASDSDDDSDDDADAAWSLRKCAASTLDVLLINLPGDVLVVVLPLLQDRMALAEWPAREAAILAFGAVAKLCIELAADKLPVLVHFLVERLGDPHPRVRQIACWTLLRYALWVCAEAHEGGQYASYFPPTFEAIVAASRDPKKVVQEAACLALSQYIEEADSTIIEFYLTALLEHFGACFRTYQRKNMVILYDCVQTFVEKMGHDALVADARNVELLLPPLLDKWLALHDDDPDLWPLLECMASVAATLCDAFAPYAVPVYERAIRILLQCIAQDQQCHTDPAIEPPEKDLSVTLLDLIDGLIQGFGAHALTLVQQNQLLAPLMDVLLACLEDYTDDVRQSAYALLGDVAIFMPDLVRPVLGLVLVTIGNEVNNRTYNSYPVYNNAVWALGEICMRTPFSELQPYFVNLVSLLVPMMVLTDMQPTVLENVAICLGRMGLTPEGAAVIAPRLAEFVLAWCSQVLYLVDNNEKETLFDGMLNIINANPDAGLGGLSNQQGRKNLSVLASCIANYPNAPDELRTKFGHLLQAYRQMLGHDVWLQIVAQLDADSRHQLSAYGV